MILREIVLDVETTGLWLNAGHRVIEVACIELEKYIPTGRIFHRYVNPLMGSMPQDAFDIHGIPIDFLWKHAPFQNIVDCLLEFIGSDTLVIHNVSFDMAFLNNELRLIDRPPIANPTIDTLSIARKRYVGASNSLDALCRRFGLDLEARRHHGAAIDCALLAAVYLELVGGRQPLFALPVAVASETAIASAGPPRPPRAHSPSPDELAAHGAMLAQIRKPIWSGHDPAAALDDEIPF